MRGIGARASVAVSSVLVAVGLISSASLPAGAEQHSSRVSAETLELLYAMSADEIRVQSRQGDTARVVLVRPTITQFTDRPARDAVEVHPATMLGTFGWTEESGRLRGSSPNAAISLVGSDTQVVRIRKAAIRGDRVILRVSGITGPVASVRGAGSMFVDSATVNVLQSQSVQLSSTLELTMTGTVYANSMLTITLQSGGTVVASRTFNPTGDGSQWTPSFTLPGGIQVTDLNVSIAFFRSAADGDISAYILVLGEVTLPPPDLVDMPGGTLQFENIPPPPPAPWPPPLDLPPGFDDAD